jgi:hypothetical protein
VTLERAHHAGGAAPAVDVDDQVTRGDRPAVPAGQDRLDGRRRDDLGHVQDAEVHRLAGDPGAGRRLATPAGARPRGQRRHLLDVEVDVLGDAGRIGVPPAGEVGKGVSDALVQPARLEIRPAEPERSRDFRGDAHPRSAHPLPAAPSGATYPRS